MIPVWPGLALAVGLALLGQGLAVGIGTGLGAQKSPVSATLLAIVLGIALRNLVRLPPQTAAGVAFALKRVLRLGIVLLGIRLSLGDLGTIGLRALPVAVITVTSALLLATGIGRLLGIPARLATLIAVGTGVCGTTAIMATSPAIGARDDEVCYAVACITLFGVLAMLVYPFAAHLVFAGDTLRTGVFLGTAVHDTAQVAGAGLVYQQYFGSPATLDAATVTKLTRNLGMLLVIPLMSILYQRQNASAQAVQPWYRMVPLFVIGFALVSVLRTAGDAVLVEGLAAERWDTVVSGVAQAATFCLTVAMAAVGLNTDLAALRETGWRPLIVGLASALLVGAVSVAAVFILL